MSVYVNTCAEGIPLFAQATAANPIVYLEARASTYQCTSASMIRDLKRATFSYQATGTIFSCSATDNTARVSGEFLKSSLSSVQNFYTVVVLAKLQSQDDSEAVYVMGWSSTLGFRLPAQNQNPDTGVLIPINLSLTDGDVVVQSGNTPSLGDLSRFVSLYKAGDTTQGETQTIRGNKIFYQLSASDFSCSGDFHLDTDISFVVGGDYDVGSEDSPANAMYANNFFGTVGSVSKPSSIYGVIPSTSSSDTAIPVGAITCFLLTGSQNREIGSEISGLTSYTIASLDGSQTSSMSSPSSARYRFLTPVKGNCLWGLVIRIS